MMMTTKVSFDWFDHWSGNDWKKSSSNNNKQQPESTTNQLEVETRGHKTMSSNGAAMGGEMIHFQLMLWHGTQFSEK